MPGQGYGQVPRVGLNFGKEPFAGNLLSPGCLRPHFFQPVFQKEISPLGPGRPALWLGTPKRKAVGKKFFLGPTGVGAKERPPIGPGLAFGVGPARRGSSWAPLGFSTGFCGQKQGIIPGPFWPDRIMRTFGGSFPRARKGGKLKASWAWGFRRNSRQGPWGRVIGGFGGPPKGLKTPSVRATKTKGETRPSGKGTLLVFKPWGLPFWPPGLGLWRKPRAREKLPFFRALLGNPGGFWTPEKGLGVRWGPKQEREHLLGGFLLPNFPSAGGRNFYLQGGGDATHLLGHRDAREKNPPRIKIPACGPNCWGGEKTPEGGATFPPFLWKMRRPLFLFKKRGAL